MEFKHACKICDRKFVNGKSMGGHMRSHFVKLQVQPKPSPPRQSESLNAPDASELLNAPKTITSAPRADSASWFLNRDSAYAHGSRAHFACSASRFSAEMGLGVRSSARKRSYRSHLQLKGMQSAHLNALLLNPKYGNFSSPDELVTVEDVARCLMMLSNNKWPGGVAHPRVTILSDSDDTSKEVDSSGADEDDKDGDDDYYDDSSDSMDLNIFGHRCHTCKRVFKSYQALGGHMRNHKRPVTQPSLAVENKEFVCKICLKVFTSGQALGGHKKVHTSTKKKLTVGTLLSKNKLPVIEVDYGSDSELGSGLKFGSAYSSGTDETSLDTTAYYNVDR